MSAAAEPAARPRVVPLPAAAPALPPGQRTATRIAEACADDEALRRILAGDESAWRELMRRHLPAVMAAAWRMLGNRAEAEDVAQETFLRLLKKARSWRTGGPSLRFWLTRVALNLCVDRHRRARTEPLDDDDALPDPAAGEATMSRRADITMTARRALALLPERQRMAVVLAYYQGFSNKDAARMMGISVDALESLLARARRTLKPALGATVREILSDG